MSALREALEALADIQARYGAPDPGSVDAVEVIPLLEATADAAAAAAFAAIPSWVADVPTWLNVTDHPAVARHEQLCDIAYLARLLFLMWEGVEVTAAGRAAALWLGETLIHLDLSA